MTAKKAAAGKDKKAKNKMDTEDLLVELQSRFDALGEKLDTLLSKSSAILSMIGRERDPGFKTEATVTKKFPIPQDNVQRERKMYKAVCADCKVTCEVPFVPRAERPVYCKTCYAARRNDKSAQNMPNREQIVAQIEKTLKIDMDETSKKPKNKKSVPKKSKKKK